MTTSTTLLQAFFLCQQAARGDLGKARTADGVNNTGGSGYVEDVSEFSYTRLGSDDLNSLFVWRYNLDIDGNDAIRQVISVSTTTHRVTVAGGNYTDVSDTDYILIGFDPREALDAMHTGYNNMGMHKEVVMTAGGYDLDMERSDQDYYDGTSGSSSVSATMTALKVKATAENKVTGEYVLELLATGTSAYVRSAQIRVVPNEQILVAPCLRVEQGTFTVKLWDATHGAYFGGSQVYAGAEFAYLYFLNAVVPTGCNFIQIEVSAAASGDKAWWDSTAFRPYQGGWFNLESWIDETWDLPLIHRMRFLNAITGASNQYAATKRQYAGDLVLGIQYQVENQHTEANPYRLYIEPTVDLGQDIFYLVTRRARNTEEPFEELTDTTTASRSELLAYLMSEVCDLLVKKTHDPYWTSAKNEWEQRLGQEVKPREEVPYQPERQVIQVRA